MAYQTRDNEFIAWYPCALGSDGQSVWRKILTTFYVHIPFCEAICDYCGFSIAKMKGARVDDYIDHLIRELQLYYDAGRFSDRTFSVGSYGGGTPSALEPEQFLRIGKQVNKVMAFSEDTEITVEANPLSLTERKVEAYMEASVNRLSLGVQSFNEKNLRAVGRPHHAEDIDRSLDIIRQSKISNFSLDLMYGIPGQTLPELTDDLRRAAETGAPHLSCFRLEIIPFTRLSLRRGAGLLPPVTKAEDEKIFEEAIVKTLHSYGYNRYGAFNFAKKGYESSHNYMVFSAPQHEFFGFGNSAFSFVNNTSYCNFTNIDDYCDAIDQGLEPISHARKATSLELMSRFFVLGLKMGGVSRSTFESNHGMKPEAIFGPTIERLMSAGLLVLTSDAYSLTSDGRFFMNNVCKEFYVLNNIQHSQHSFSFVPTITPNDVEMFSRKARRRDSFSVGEDD